MPSPKPNPHPNLGQVGLAALGLLGQPAAWAVDTSAFEAKAAKYRAEREKRELTKPVVTSSVETPRPVWPASLNAAQAAARPRPAEQLGAALGASLNAAEAGRSSGQPESEQNRTARGAMPERSRGWPNVLAEGCASSAFDIDQA